MLKPHIPKLQVAKFHTQQLQQLTWDAMTGQTPVLDRAELSDYLSQLFRSNTMLPGVKPGFTSLMEFSMRILEEFANNADAQLPMAFTEDLLSPLLRRLQRRKVDLQYIETVIDHAIVYYQNHERERKNHQHDVVCQIVKYWCISPATFEARLISLFELHRFYPPKARNGDSYVHDLSHDLAIFNAARKSMRYELLRLFCRYALGAGYNIDSDQDLEDIPISTWPVSFFQAIETESGMSLLKRLIKRKPQGDFLELQPKDHDDYVFHTIFSHPPELGARHGDPRLLLLYLNRAAANNAADAEAYVDVARKRAATNREHEGRAFFVTSAAFYAIASGSLELYCKTIKWMRRFTGDYKVVSTVYNANVVLTVEGIALLSGLPSNLGECKLADICRNILKGNETLLQFLDSATAALREPAFNVSNWGGALSLFSRVVKSRVGQAAKLQRCLKLSDEELYDILWAPTLTMLINAERIGLASEHAELEFDDPLGPLAGPSRGRFRYHNTSEESMRQPLAPTFRFLDNLARSRDELWKELRPTWNPAVAALPPTFPRGLPIQCLTGRYNIATERAALYTPYLTARAKAIVMIEPSLAFSKPPADEETQLAIGHFVDDYKCALEIYINQHSPGTEREEALATATRHAIHQLSGRLRPDEVERFWSPVLARLGLSLDHVSCKSKDQQCYPIIPANIDPSEPNEWHPESAMTKGSEARKLQPTVLDCMLSTKSMSSRNKKAILCISDAQVPASLAPSMWS